MKLWNIKRKVASLLLGYDPTTGREVKIVDKIEIVPEGSMIKQPIFCLQTPDIENGYYRRKDKAYVLNLEDAMVWRRENPDHRSVSVIEGYVRGNKWYYPTAQEGRPLTDPKDLKG